MVNWYALHLRIAQGVSWPAYPCHLALLFDSSQGEQDASLYFGHTSQSSDVYSFIATITPQGVHAHAAAHIPHAQRAIVATTDELLPVRTQRHIHHHSGMPF